MIAAALFILSACASATPGAGEPADAVSKWLQRCENVAERVAHEYLEDVDLTTISQLTGGIVAIHTGSHSIDIKVDRDRLEERAAELYAQWRDLIATKEVPPVDTEFGLRIVNAPHSAKPPQRAVILVHGMDDLGVMWTNLAPALVREGHVLAKFRYPSAGPIAEATDLLAQQLELFHTQGVEEVDIVAHSMGGLVARDLLTRTEYYAGDGHGGKRFPKVNRVVMIGTPNHGASLARYRGVLGLGKKAYRTLTGESDQLVNEGNGEAAIDLLPTSEFLHDLNQRPLPKNVAMTIIAGRCSSGRLSALANSESGLGDYLADMAEKLGDGCVSLDSARLEGVEDFVIVSGNHLSILSSFGDQSHTPAAVPVVVERLKK